MKFKKGDEVVVVCLDYKYPAPKESIGMTGIIGKAAKGKERRHNVEFPIAIGTGIPSNNYWYYDHEIVKVASLTELEKVVYGL